MASSRLVGPVLLWPRPRQCLTLSTYARWRSWMVVSPDFATLQMMMWSSGRQTSEGEPTYERIRSVCMYGCVLWHRFGSAVECTLERRRLWNRHRLLHYVGSCPTEADSGQLPVIPAIGQWQRKHCKNGAITLSRTNIHEYIYLDAY